MEANTACTRDSSIKGGGDYQQHFDPAEYLKTYYVESSVVYHMNHSLHDLFSKGKHYNM